MQFEVFPIEYGIGNINTGSFRIPDNQKIFFLKICITHIRSILNFKRTPSIKSIHLTEATMMDTKPISENSSKPFKQSI